MNLIEIGTLSEDQCRAYFERLRWPNGPVCPRCGADKPYTLTPNPDAKHPVRPGVYKCRAKGCRKPFSVTVGTVMERSHVSMKVWLTAFHLLCSSKKGFSAKQLERETGVDLKTAWFVFHRVREAMKRPPVVDKLRGFVEADETYVGGRPRAYEKGTPGRPGPRSKKKVPVFALVERGGRVRSFPVWHVTGRNLQSVIREHVAPETRFFTDELSAYQTIGKLFPRHDVVTHSANEYVRGEAHVNTVEGFFSLLKRGINGIYHHVGKQHLGRYLHEFDFRYSTRKLTDSQRTELAVKGASGRRLTYRTPTHAEASRG